MENKEEVSMGTYERIRYLEQGASGYFVTYVPKSKRLRKLINVKEYITDDRIKDLILALRRGNYLDVACDIAGLPYKSVREWIRKGGEVLAKYEDDLYSVPDEDLFFAKLFLDVKRAQAEAEDSFLNILRAAAEGGQWQAAAWILERSRKKWKKVQKIDIDRKDERTVKVEVYLPDNQRVSLPKEEAKKLASGEAEDADYEIIGDSDGQE